MSKLPAEVSKVLDRFDQALTAIEQKVTPFVDTPIKDIVPRLDSIETAKLNLAYSYTMNSLFYMYLRVHGISPQTHPVKRELERVKSYMNKTLGLEAELKNKALQKENAKTSGNTESPEEEEKEEAVPESRTPESKQHKKRFAEQESSNTSKSQKVDRASTPKNKQGKSNKNQKGSSTQKSSKSKRR